MRPYPNPDNPLRPKVRRVRKYIGYAETYEEAVLMLAQYNSNPIDLDYKDITFEELFDMYWKTKKGTVSKSWEKSFIASYKAMESLHNEKINDLKTADFERLFEETDKNYPTMKKMKILLNQMFDYADSHDMLYKNYTHYISLHKYVDKNPNAIKRDIFSKADIKRLWKNSDDMFNSIVVILIYTGLRISELFNLTRDNVHLNEKYLDIRASKTDAGVRLVPLHEAIIPLVKKWYDEGNTYLIFNARGNQMKYRDYRDTYWDKIMEELELGDHKPHDTRHTFVSLLQSSGCDERVLKKIVGHKGQMDFTLKVYTKYEMDKLLEEVNKIKI